MRHIPLLAEEGWMRHQKNAAKPQRRRRHPSSARRGMCCPENFVQKTKSCSLVTQRQNTKGTNLFCAFCVPFCAFCVLFPNCCAKPVCEYFVKQLFYRYCYFCLLYSLQLCTRS